MIASCSDLKNSSQYCWRNPLSNFSLLPLVLITVGGNGLCFFGIVPCGCVLSLSVTKSAWIGCRFSLEISARMIICVHA